MKTGKHFLSYLADFFLEWEMFQTKFVEKIKTRISWSITLFCSENHAVYEIMWENIAEAGRPKTTVWSMSFASWLIQG